MKVSTLTTIIIIGTIKKMMLVNMFEQVCIDTIICNTYWFYFKIIIIISVHHLVIQFLIFLQIVCKEPFKNC